MMTREQQLYHDRFPTMAPLLLMPPTPITPNTQREQQEKEEQQRQHQQQSNENFAASTLA